MGCGAFEGSKGSTSLGPVKLPILVFIYTGSQLFAVGGNSVHPEKSEYVQGMGLGEVVCPLQIKHIVIVERLIHLKAKSATHLKLFNCGDKPVQNGPSLVEDWQSGFTRKFLFRDFNFVTKAPSWPL